MSFQDKLNSIVENTLNGYRTELDSVLKTSVEKDNNDKVVAQEKNDEEIKQETDFEK